MKDVLKNSYLAQLPQGTLSLAGLLGLQQGKPFYATLADAASQRRAMEKEDLNQYKELAANMALADYATAQGNPGLASLIQQGVDPRVALELEQYMNPPAQAQDPYANLIKTSAGIYEPYIDENTGQTQLRNLTGNERNYQDLQLQSASERNQYNKKLGEVSKTYGGAIALDKELEKLDKYFEEYNQVAPGFAKSGNAGPRYAPEFTRTFSGQKARTAADVINKFKEDIKLKYVQQAGTPRLKILGETLVNAIPNLGQTPEAQKEILSNLREMVNKEIFVGKFLNEWKKYAPGRLGEGEAIATELIGEMNLFDSNGKLKNINIPRLAREQFEALYNRGILIPESVNEEEIISEAEVLPTAMGEDEELLTIIRNAYPNYGR